MATVIAKVTLYCTDPNFSPKELSLVITDISFIQERLEKYFVTQPAFTYSKFTVETLEQGAKLRNVSVFLVPLLLTLNTFHTLF